MVPADLDEVMAIERTSFRHPWSSNFFLEELQVACARSILAQVNDKIVGYVLFWLLPEAIDIHNIAVAHRFPPSTALRQTLLQQVIEQARSRNSARVTLEVRVSNIAAQKLYESVGFVSQGLRKGLLLRRRRRCRDYGA